MTWALLAKFVRGYLKGVPCHGKTRLSGARLEREKRISVCILDISASSNA
jgi:hypothetical protein